jgi:glycosyltransferase involved in cell wall biosynthesis
MTLTIYVLAYNEEKNLGACLETLTFADELIVILDKCTDRSKEIALSFNVKIIEGAWQYEGEKRNLAIENSTGDWIMDIDADERIPPALATEIKQVIATSPYDLHCIPFDNYIGNTLVKHGWGAYMGVSQKVALYRRGAKTYNATSITHSEVIMKGRFGPVLKNAIIHYIDKDLSDTLRRFDRYAQARAQQMYNDGINESFARNFIRIFSRFYKCYIRRQGYKEGAIGFFIAMLAGLYPIASYIKWKYKI